MLRLRWWNTKQKILAPAYWILGFLLDEPLVRLGFSNVLYDMGAFRRRWVEVWRLRQLAVAHQKLLPTKVA